jgi:hypothetical protein
MIKMLLIRPAMAVIHIPGMPPLVATERWLGKGEEKPRNRDTAPVPPARGGPLHPGNTASRSGSHGGKHRSMLAEYRCTWPAARVRGPVRNAARTTFGPDFSLSLGVGATGKKCVNAQVTAAIFPPQHCFPRRIAAFATGKTTGTKFLCAAFASGPRQQRMCHAQCTHEHGTADAAAASFGRSCVWGSKGDTPWRGAGRSPASATLLHPYPERAEPESTAAYSNRARRSLAKDALPRNLHKFARCRIFANRND